MEGIPIRNARRGDIPSLLLLWNAMMQENAAADERLALHPRAKEHMTAEFARWIQDPKHCVVVAEENGHLIVGFAAASISPGNGFQVPAVVGRISDCFVARPRRRLGIARRLTGRVTDLLYEKGVNAVRVAVAVENEGARAFWKAIGWDDLEEVLERPIADPASGGKPPEEEPSAGQGPVTEA
jgi:ribosomal protein S18 acetylase RimI-like enzyme